MGRWNTPRSHGERACFSGKKAKRQLSLADRGGWKSGGGIGSCSLHLFLLPGRSCCVTHKFLFPAFKLNLGGLYINVLKWLLLCPAESLARCHPCGALGLR